MSLFPPLGLGEAIIFELRQGPREMNDLIKALHARGQRVTKQGVYKAVRGLRGQEIVFLQAGEVSLSLRWLERLENFVSLTQRSYVDSSVGAGHFLNLTDGERILYTFKNPVSLDAFWNHVLYLLFEAMPELDRWYAYASHCWFMLARGKEERALYRFMNKRDVRVLYTVGHQTPLDHLVASHFDGRMTQYHMLERPLFSERRNHLGLVINLLGDFVIQAEYDKKMTEAIESFYKKHRAVDAENLRELEAIVSTPTRTKLMITRNKSKARKLVRLFEKHFYFGDK